MSRRLEVDVESGEALDLGLGFLKMLEITAGSYANGNDPGGGQKLVYKREGRMAGAVLSLSK